MLNLFDYRFVSCISVVNMLLVNTLQPKIRNLTTDTSIIKTHSSVTCAHLRILGITAAFSMRFVDL